MPPAKHAALGASGAHRWMACPGSIRLSEEVPDSDTDSIYAQKGSAAHEVAEMCLSRGHDAEQYVGSHITLDRGEEYVAIEVTEEMAEAVQVYLDHVRSVVPAGDTPGDFGVEVRFSLEKLNPPAPMYGTADAVYWDPEERTLDVFDYKHGKGVVVDPEENPQLMYYALGAVLDLEVKPEMIYVTIVQPRANHPTEGPIRGWAFGWNQLVAFKENLLLAADQAMQPDAPVGPVGDHCKWCPAKAICPAQRDNALAVAQSDFADIPTTGPPPPETLPTETLVEILQAAPHMEEWIKEVRAYAKDKLKQGEEVPGYKLVKKRAYRRWADDEEAEEWLRKRFNVGDIFKRKLVSPYQAEQLLKDRPRTELPDDFIVSKSSGVNLASEDNPRPAVTPALLAAEEFDT